MPYIDFIHEPIVEQCEGCKKASDGCCVVYKDPARQWSNGRCPLCTVKENTGPVKAKKKLNPLKAAAGKGGQRPYTYKKGSYEKSWVEPSKGGGK